jgi:hypothetical protein
MERKNVVWNARILKRGIGEEWEKVMIVLFMSL